MQIQMQVVEDPVAVAHAARDVVTSHLDAAAIARGRASLALSGGSTPRALYELFARHGDAARWPTLHIFYGDERAVPPDHPDSNHRMASEAWLDASGIPRDRIHRMRGEAPDLDAEAARYEEELRQVLGAPPALDVVLLGMGEDAHTASIFPNTPAASEQNRAVMALHDGAPKHRRITITPRALADARLLLVLVTGKAKAEVIKEAIYGPIDVERMPIQRALREHPNAMLILDRDAAAALGGMRM